MKYKRAMSGNSKENPSDEVVLRSYIEEAIKILYFDRKHLFFEGDRDFVKMSKTYSFVTGEIKSMIDKKPRIMIPNGDRFSYIIMNEETANDICDFLNFILLSPPNSFKLKPKTKRYAMIGLMRVPSIDFLLLSLLEFRFPDYWRDKISLYYSASVAIMQIISRNTTNPRIQAISSKVKTPDRNSEEWEEINDLNKKFTQWIRLGLIG